MEAKKIIIGKTTYTIMYVRGHVVGKDKNFETKVRGGTSKNSSGETVAGPITSDTIIHDKIYIQHDGEKETVVELQNWDIACRVGHQLMAVRIFENDNNIGPYVVIKNFSTGNEQINKAEIDILSYQFGMTGCFPLFLAIPLYFSVGEVFTLSMTAAFAIFLIIKWVVNSKARAKVIMAELREFLDSQK